MTPSHQPHPSALVIGGGISGITVALELAEAGLDAHLVEQHPSLGGRVAQLHKYFPKLCPPMCGLEINFRRIRATSKIHIHTLAHVSSVRGAPGDFEVTLEKKPRLINDRCTACDACVDVCPVERDHDFNFGMSKTKAIYLPYPLAFPPHYVIDPDACEGSSCAKCVEACSFDAIDLDMQPSSLSLRVGAVVVATGWNPYDAARLTNLGFGVHPDVITNMMMERLASPDGPTKGQILRPSNGEKPESVVFVQCAGSRDENHLPFCSGVCCMASLKQVTYIRELLPDAKIHIFYIDIRSSGRLEDFYNKVREMDNVTIERGKVARLGDREDGLTIEVEDTLSGQRRQMDTDLLVLATGMAPTLGDRLLPFPMHLDENHFGITDLENTGIIVAGCAKRPFDVSSSVQDATGAAIRAIQSNARGASHG